MKTKVSSKGQVVLPNPIRRQLGIEAGDPLDARIEGGEIILSLVRPKKRLGKIIISSITGLPVLTFGEGAPIITSEMVAKLLEDFP